MLRKIAYAALTSLLVACAPSMSVSDGTSIQGTASPSTSPSNTASATPSPTPSQSTTPLQECSAIEPPPGSWPAIAQAALQELITRYQDHCSRVADFDYYFSLPPDLTDKQKEAVIRWYTDALRSATRVYGDLLYSDKPIAIFYKTSAQEMCDDLLDFLTAEKASSRALESVRSMEWACAPTSDWDAVYDAPGYGASVLRAESPGYDFIIVNMGNAAELKTKDPYEALMPTFQTPSHELFHLAQAANRSQGATLWWAEGGASYVGHMTAAMQGMVSYAKARNDSLVAYACGEIVRNGKSGPPSISALSGWWEQADGKWWNGMAYQLGALASEYVLGTYGWQKFFTWASNFEGKEYAYLEARSLSTFGITLDRLHRDIDEYLKTTIGLDQC